MDPLICCVLGICCPPFSESQREAFEKVLTSKVGADKAKLIADDLFKEFAAVTAKIAEAC